MPHYRQASAENKIPEPVRYLPVRFCSRMHLSPYRRTPSHPYQPANTHRPQDMKRKICSIIQGIPRRIKTCPKKRSRCSPSARICCQSVSPADPIHQAVSCHIKLLRMLPKKKQPRKSAIPICSIVIFPGCCTVSVIIYHPAALLFL